MTKVFLINPFSFEAVGLNSKSEIIHNVPHKSFLSFLRAKGIEVEHQYLGENMFRENRKIHKENFFRIDYKLNRSNKKFKKQFSNAYLKYISVENPDFVIINMSAHASLFCYAIAKSQLERGKKYICMLGGQHFSNTNSNFDYYQGAHKIIVHTEIQKQDMLGMHMFKNKDIFVMPLGINIVNYSKSNNVSNDVVYTGRIINWKRIELAIEAIKYARKNGMESNLDIYGPISNIKYYKDLVKRIKEENLEEYIKFKGVVGNKTLNDLYMKYSLFLLPSKKETFGMVMIEAMASGLPVIAVNDKGGPLDIIRDGIDGFLCNEEDFPETVFNALSDKNRLAEIKENAFLRSHNEFDFKTINQKLFLDLELDG